MAADETEVITILSSRKSREQRFRLMVAPSASNFIPTRKRQVLTSRFVKLENKTTIDWLEK